MGRFDLICPDGMPLVWALNSKLAAHQKLTDRVYGPTLMLETLKATRRPADSAHFLLGGRQSTLDKLTRSFAAAVSRCAIAGSHSPPFGEWPADEFDRICEKIRASGPT